MRSRYQRRNLVKATLIIVLVGAVWIAASKGEYRHVTLQVVADNYADSKYPDKAYGLRPILYVGNSYDKSQDIWGHERIFIKFDVSPVPTEALILSAVLKLYIYYPPKIELPTIVCRVTKDWAEANQTWINQPSSSPAEMSRNTIGLEADVWVSWDVTALTRDWMNKPSENFGATIKALVEEKIRDHSAGAWSKECGITGLEPRLEVTYITEALGLSTLTLIAAVTLILVTFSPKVRKQVSVPRSASPRQFTRMWICLEHARHQLECLPCLLSHSASSASLSGNVSASVKLSRADEKEGEKIPSLGHSEGRKQFRVFPSVGMFPLILSTSSLGFCNALLAKTLSQ